MRSPLAGLRVLDFTQWIAGPYCTKLLADYGANVIKVEPPWGDPGRRLGPFPNDEPVQAAGALFAFLNTSKLGITLDLKSAFAPRAVASLVAKVDVVVESFRPGVLDRLGFPYSQLREINPGLSMTSISNFGQTGPYRDWKASEVTLYAMGGAMHATGEPDRPPVKLAGSIAQFHGGNVACMATLGSVMEAKLRGTGQHVDVSLFETQVGNIDRRTPFLVGHAYHGEVASREPAASGSFPNGIYACKDGYFHITGGVQFFDRVCLMMGMPELAEDARFRGPSALTDPNRREEFEAIFVPWMLERTRAEATEAGQQAKVPCAPVAAPSDVLKDEHLRARDSFVSVDLEANGAVNAPGPPFRFSKGAWQAPSAPALGQHNAEVYNDLLQLSPAELQQAKALGYI